MRCRTVQSSTLAYFKPDLSTTGGIGDSLKGFSLSTGPISPSTNTAGPCGLRRPVISAKRDEHGCSRGALDTTAQRRTGCCYGLRPASDLTTELYDSTMQPVRDAVDANRQVQCAGGGERTCVHRHAERCECVSGLLPLAIDRRSKKGQPMDWLPFCFGISGGRSLGRCEPGP